MALNVKKGDNVVVLAGKDKGKTGKVLSANPAKGTVVVEGVNVITKHNKPRSAQDKGGIAKENGNIDVSNVQIICPACGKATRVAHTEENGKKIRTCKKCGKALDVKAAKTEKKTRRSSKAAAVSEEATEVVAQETAPKKTTTRRTTAKKTEDGAVKKTTTTRRTVKKTEESSEQ